MTEIAGQDLGKFTCSGGLSCSGTNASGGNVVPVLLDLRPLSDLVGPPFFDGEENIRVIKERLTGEISRYMSERKSRVREEPAAKFLRISGLTDLQCQLWTETESGAKRQKLPLESCGVANRSFAIDARSAVSETVNGAGVWVVPAPDSMTKTLASGSIVSVLSMSADVTIPGVICPANPPQPTPALSLTGLANFLVPPRLTACFILSDPKSESIGRVPAGCSATGVFTAAANVEIISGETLFNPGSAPPGTPPDIRLCGGR